MLSKQQKQRYGQVLRQQMKQKQQRKKMQDLSKRGQNTRIAPQLIPQQKEQMYYQPTVMQKQNPIIPHPLLDPKQQLQKKFQGPEYNYFGSLGGGNQIRRDQPNRNNISMPNGVRMQPEQLMQYSNNRNYGQGYPQMIPQQQRVIGRINTQQQERNYYQNQPQSISPPTINYPGQRISTNQNNYYPQNPLGSNRINYNPYQPQGQIQQPYGIRDVQQPTSFDYIPGTNSRLQQQQYSYPNGMMNSYQQNMNMPSQNMNIPSQNMNMPPPQQQQRQIYQPIQQQQQMMSPQQTNNKDSQQLMQVYRKGGRNLLKLQNQTIDEHLIKQKRKLQIQKQLKQQIQEAQRKKKQQKQRLQRQQQQEQRKQLAYIAQQKRKIQEQQRKQKQQRQKVIDQNIRNLQKKKQLQQQAKKKVIREQQQRRQKQRKQAQFQRAKIQQQRNQQIKRNQKIPVNYATQQSNLPRNKLSMHEDDNTSVVSSEISSLQKGYSTNLPKQFFMKQRQRINPLNNNKKYQSLTYEVQKMQDQIRKQGQIFNKQMYKVKQDAQKALIQKRKAEQQIQRLKKQLKRKMDQDNQKLLRALQTNDYRNQYGLPPQQSNNYGYNQNSNNYNTQNQQPYQNLNKNSKSYEDYQQPEQRGYQNNVPKKPLKQKQSQRLVRQDYEPSKFNSREQQYQNFNQSMAGLVSLDGDSKHIPINLPNAQNLTISQVQNFAKDSSYFQKGTFNKNSPQKMQKYSNKIHQNESIPEQQNQQRDYGVSRKSNRNVNMNIKSNKQIIQSKDQLDRLMDSRAKSRGGWGQMSSVNSDITKQIQQLLRNKAPNNQKNNQRPSSISNAGKQSLARQGYAYDGFTLNSNVGTSLNQGGTIDIDRINGRNDARLKQLRNLGVQTINTNGDDDLERLDKLLNKYK